jgi:hypothetical protein
MMGAQIRRELEIRAGAAYAVAYKTEAAGTETARNGTKRC